MNGNIEVIIKTLFLQISNVVLKHVFFSFIFQKLYQMYVEDEIKYMFLDDMLKADEEKIQSRSRDSLTWLKRYNIVYFQLKFA